MDRRLGYLNTDGTYGDSKISLGGKLSFADKGIRGIRSIAKEYTSDGKKTEWYDDKYKQIAKHKDLLDLYEFINDVMDEMRSILPEHTRRNVSSNTMPFIAKDMMQMFSTNASMGMANM